MGSDRAGTCCQRALDAVECQRVPGADPANGRPGGRCLTLGRPGRADRSDRSGARLCDNAPAHDIGPSLHYARRPRRPAQHRDRRPRRPRQDHARRRDAPPDGRVPREPGRRRPGPRFDGPRAREGHHDPRQADDRRLRGVRLNIVDTPGHADFGGEVERSLLMVDCGAAARRRGRGAAARRPATSSRRRWPGICPSSSRSTRSIEATPGPPRSSTRSTSSSSTSARATTRSSSRSSTRTRSSARPRWTSRCPGTDLRPLLDLLVRVTPPPTYEPGHPLQLLVTNLVGQRLRRPDGGRAHLERHDQGGPAHHRGARGGRRHRRHRRARPDGDADRHGHSLHDGPRHRARRHPRGRPGRDRRGRRAARGDDRRHAHRSGRSAAAAAPRRRRADAADDVRREHVAACRAATAGT